MFEDTIYRDVPPSLLLVGTSPQVKCARGNSDYTDISTAMAQGVIELGFIAFSSLRARCNQPNRRRQWDPWASFFLNPTLNPMPSPRVYFLQRVNKHLRSNAPDEIDLVVYPGGVALGRGATVRFMAPAISRLHCRVGC